MRKISAAILFITIVASVAVMWVTSKWATTIPEVATCALAALWAAAFAIRAERPCFSIALLPLSGIVLWAVLQILLGISIYHFQSWLAIVYWTGNLATFFAAQQTFSDAGLRNRFLRALLIFGFIVSVVSALQALTSNGRIFWIFPTVFAGWNLLGPFVYHNQFAAFIELLLPIALYNAFTDRNWRAIYVLFAATMYASVIISASRAGFVLTSAELLIVPALMVRAHNLRLRAAAGAVAVLAAMVLLLGISAGTDVLASRFALKDPFAIRREFNYSSLAMIREHPLAGVGLGNWPVAYPAHALFDNGLFANQAHNDWAQWTVEGGIPLLALFIWLAIWAFPRAVRTVWGLGVCAIFLHSFVDYPIQRTAVAVVYFVILGSLSSWQSEMVEK